MTWLLNGWVCPRLWDSPGLPASAWNLDSDSETCEFGEEGLIHALEEALARAEEEQNEMRRAQEALQQALKGVCVVCFEETIGGVTCCPSAPPFDTGPDHFLCRNCVPNYVLCSLEQDDGSNQRLMERRNLGHCLRCPCSRPALGCNGFLDLRQVAPFLNEAACVRLEAVIEADHRHSQWQKECKYNEDPEFMREALLRLMPAAVQCRSCGYGPIDHVGCDDLDVHQWQWQGNSQILNQCPECGWWAHDINSWPKWDGNLRQ